MRSIARPIFLISSLFLTVSSAHAQVTGSGAPGQVTFWTGTTSVAGDTALNWNSSNNRLSINSASPVATLQVMYDANATLIELGGQPGGTAARALAVADGSTGIPTSSTHPTFVVQRVDSTNDPSTAVIPFEFGAKKVSGAGYLYGLHSYVEVDSATLTDAVATTGSIVMEPSSTPTAPQTGFAMWARAERLVTGTRIASAEFDCINSTGTDAPAPGSADVNNYTLGLQIVGGGTGKNTMALDIANGGGPFWAGVVFDSTSIANSGYGIDMRQFNTSATPIRLGNNTYIKARNFADSADIRLLGAGGDDTVRIGADDIIIGTNLVISPGGGFGTKNVGIGTTGPVADAALEVNGGTSRGLRITPRSTAGPPSGGTWSKGTLVVDSNGILYIRLAGSWQKVGAQQ